MRFDEMELQAATVPALPEVSPVERSADAIHASRFRRFLALLTDCSLFAALTLALSPLLPATPDLLPLLGLAGFVLTVSYYYFVGSWLLWGKTVGGAIFDVRVAGVSTASMSLKQASIRWAATLVSLLIGGLPFLLAALPSRESAPDILSGTRCLAS